MLLEKKAPVNIAEPGTVLEVQLFFFQTKLHQLFLESFDFFWCLFPWFGLFLLFSSLLVVVHLSIFHVTSAAVLQSQKIWRATSTSCFVRLKRPNAAARMLAVCPFSLPSWGVLSTASIIASKPEIFSDCSHCLTIRELNATQLGSACWRYIVFGASYSCTELHIKSCQYLVTSKIPLACRLWSYRDVIINFPTPFSVKITWDDQLSGMEKFVFFPLEDGGIDLHHQVCVGVCPASSTATVVTYLKPTERRLGSLVDAIPLGISETDSLLQPQGMHAPAAAPAAPAAAPAAPAAPDRETVPAGMTAPESPLVMEGPSISVEPSPSVVTAPAAAPVDLQEVVVRGYPSFPVAGVLCVPNVRDFEGNITELTGKNIALQAALQVSELWHNQEVLLLAALVTMLMCLIFLCFVENCAKVLVNISVSALIIVPAAFGAYVVYKHHSKLAVAENEVSIISPEFAMTAAICGFVVSISMLLCACCLCGKCQQAAETVEEAAECLMTMPSLLLEPFISFVVKVPVFVLGCLVFIMLIGSGDYHGAVDLTKPQSLVHPDQFSSLSAIYFLFAWLLVMELLHYFSIFVVIYVAEVWFFKHFKQTERSSFCSMCGVKLLCKGFGAALQHLGSLIFASSCLALLRPIRWIMKAFLLAEEAASYTEVGTCILKVARWAVDLCFGFIQKLGEILGTFLVSAFLSFTRSSLSLLLVLICMRFFRLFKLCFVHGWYLQMHAGSHGVWFDWI